MEREGDFNSWLKVSLKEGKNREIKKVLEYFGLQVNRLIRVSFGPFQLGSLTVGEVKVIEDKMLKNTNVIAYYQNDSVFLLSRETCTGASISNTHCSWAVKASHSLPFLM